MRTFNRQEFIKDFQIIGSDDFYFNTICIDSRKLKPGDIFIAINGNNYDSHNFVFQAVKAGAIAIVVERPIKGCNVPQIITNNSISFLGFIAKKIRQEFTGKVFALTGSSGKTTCKQMLKSILEQNGNTHATKGNLNNKIGVPLTLFDLPINTDYLITELGADCLGEIDYLSNIIKPNIAMITNVGSAHLEGFKTQPNTAAGKGEIFNYLQKNDIAILNFDDKFYPYWYSKLTSNKVISFSLTNSKSDIYATDIDRLSSEFTINLPNNHLRIKLPIMGKHNIYNALSVASMAYAANIPINAISKGISNYKTTIGRMDITNFEKVMLIDDSYNANPESVLAATKILSHKKTTRILVIGDMKELGNNSIEIHQKLAYQLASCADLFFCYGELMHYFSDILNDKAQYFDCIDLLNQNLLSYINQNNSPITVLVKGSFSMNMNRVVDFLKQNLKEA